jgi:maltokinase
MTANGCGVELPEYLNRWVAKQRWFASKGHLPSLVSIGQWALPTEEPAVNIRTELVFDASAATRTLYQLPLTERPSPLPGGERALIAEVDGATESSRFVYDAPYDPAYARALLRFILDQGVSPAARNVNASARGETLFDGGPGHPSTVMASSRVLSGEQSNTSIIYDCVDDAGEPVRPVICKVFRALHHGENPDVSVQSALARAGSRFVPEPVGCVVGYWDELDPAGSRTPGSRTMGHLAFAQEFLPGVEDAWRAALTSAAAGEDFSEQARKLGEATAAVHADLAAVMPTHAATPGVIAAELDNMRERYRAAAAEVPALAGYRNPIEAVFARARTVPWPRLQRIHGDYHLGQVLDVPGRGWVLVDFEGEPLRPLAERTQPDVPLKDVAGMLRSFSYVAGTVERAHRDHIALTAAAWASACRQAFLEGYADRSGQNLTEQGALLDAFELDKALYEAVYETRNRPAWLPIPLAAVRHIVAAVSAGVTERS